MKTFLAVVLLVTGLGLGGFAYSCYSNYADETRVARFFRAHRDEVPLWGENREEFITRNLMMADRDRNLAILSGGGGLLLCAVGAGLFVRRGREGTSNAAPDGGPAEDPVRRAEVADLWASVALERPIDVQYSRSHPIALAVVLAFFIGISLLGVAINGVTKTSCLMLVLCLSSSAALYYVVERMLKKSVKLFDRSGLTRRDHRRLSWAEFQGVNYITEVRHGLRTVERLLRIELLFDSDKALLIPQRIKNLEEISNLVDTMPGVHQKRGKRI